MYLTRASKRFKKNFQKLDKNSQKAIEKAILQLGREPRHPSLRTKKMQGYEDIFEASANMDIRITFQHEKPNTIILRNCGHHDRTLKNP